MLKPRLLIVDYDPDTLAAVGRALRLAGYHVVTAQGGTFGLELIQSKDFDLILTDLRMPDISGLELLAEAREHAPQTPVVVFTACGTTATEYAVKRLGGADFINGLWSDDTLLEKVRTNLQNCSGLLEGANTGTFIGPATRRWLRAILPIARSKADLPRVEDWSDELRKGMSTIKRWCEHCGVTAADSLDFARAVRIVLQYLWAPLRVVRRSGNCRA